VEAPQEMAWGGGATGSGTSGGPHMGSFF